MVGALAFSFVPLQPPALPWGSNPDVLNSRTCRFTSRINPMRANIVG